MEVRGESGGIGVYVAEEGGFVGPASVEASFFAGDHEADEAADEGGDESGLEAELAVDVVQDGGDPGCERATLAGKVREGRHH